jgi:proline iminopeptidase
VSESTTSRTAPPQVGAVRVNGTTLHVESVGEGEPCLCLHGGPGTDSSGLVRSLGPLAATLGLRLIFYDHRGHGRSEWVPVEQCTQDQLVHDIEGVRQALGLGRAHVLGISWGGFLGLMYAARYPGSLRALAVVGASASRDFMPRAEANARRRATPEQWAAYRALWDGSLPSDEAFQEAFATIRPLYFHDQRLAAAANAARADTRHRLAVRNFVIHHEYSRYDCRAELALIACPALVMVGRHDWICPVDQAEEIHRLIPQSELEIFESSGHSPQIEERAAFLRRLQAFLAAVPERRDDAGARPHR